MRGSEGTFTRSRSSGTNARLGMPNLTARYPRSRLMSSLSWRIKRLRAMRPKEVLFRLKQAALIREELRREPSPVAGRAYELLAELPTPTETRTIEYFDFHFPFPEVLPDWHADIHTGIVVSKKRWPEIDYRKSDEV